MRKFKRLIRKETIKRLKTQKRGKAFDKSKKIMRKLFSSREFKKAQTIMFYASKKEEVDTHIMIDEALKMGKRVALPRCTSQKTIIPKEITSRNKDLEKGDHDIYEPKKKCKHIQPKDLDLIIVPGVAFDKKNIRLGRGKGYYDKFLKDLPGRIPSIGLAFDFQIKACLPKDSHDIPVSKIITG